jgi:hypothetical protein
MCGPLMCTACKTEFVFIENEEDRERLGRSYMCPECKSVEHGKYLLGIPESEWNSYTFGTP